MPPSSIVFNMIFSLLALLLIVWIAQAAVSRLGAGPIRFRLGIASLPDRGQVKATKMGFLFAFLCFVLVVVMEIIFSPPEPLLAPILFLCGWVFFVGLTLPQRHEKRWLVFAAGLLLLVAGAVLLASGLRIIRFADTSVHQWPRALMIVYSMILFGMGAATLQESMTWTRVRERGIECPGPMFWTTQPWSRIIVKDWQAREGGFALHLTIRSPQGFFSQGFTPGGEIIVPVAASERAALEAFLAEHTAAPG
jgi:hypothetical protein